jgi:hypothetical protein
MHIVIVKQPRNKNFPDEGMNAEGKGGKIT